MESTPNVLLHVLFSKYMGDRMLKSSTIGGVLAYASSLTAGKRRGDCKKKARLQKRWILHYKTQQRAVNITGIL